MYCKNIAIFSHTIALGGSERVACLLADLLSEECYNVYLIIQKKSDLSYSLKNNITIYNLENSKNKYKRTREILTKYNIDLCIFNDHFIDETFNFIKLSNKSGIRTIAIEHSSFFFPFYALDTTNFTKRNDGYQYVDRLIVLSPKLEQIWNALGIARATFIPNPLTFKKHGQHADKKEKNLIFIGRICYMKGIFEALEIVSRVAKKFKNVKLYILGRFESNEIENNVKKRVNELCINDNIIFIGHTNNIEPYLSSAYVHIMPSMIEGAPMSFYEAKSFGIPTVCFDIPTLFLSTESAGCIMVGKNDINGMTNAIIRLLDDEQYWETMSKRAMDSLSEIDEKLIASKWNKVISDIFTNNNEPSTEEYRDNSHIILKEFSSAIDWYNKKDVSTLYNDIKYLIPIHKIITKTLPKGSPQRSILKKLFHFLKKLTTLN